MLTHGMSPLRRRDRPDDFTRRHRRRPLERQRRLDIEPLAGDERYDGSTFTDARIALYLKGKVGAQLPDRPPRSTRPRTTSTRCWTVDAVADPRRVLRIPRPRPLLPGLRRARLDRRRRHPGTAATCASTADHDACAGNFNTSFTGTELPGADRSLYGAMVAGGRNDHGSATPATASSVRLAARSRSSPTTSSARRRGSLYYLRETDIVQGISKSVENGHTTARSARVAKLTPWCVAATTRSTRSRVACCSSGQLPSTPSKSAVVNSISDDAARRPTSSSSTQRDGRLLQADLHRCARARRRVLRDAVAEATSTRTATPRTTSCSAAT